MSKFRDKMRKGRAVLHKYMGDGAIVFDWPQTGPDFVVTNIQVRVHEKFLAQGDLAGTNAHYAEVEDSSPIGVFWLDQPAGFQPKRGKYLLTEYGRGYRIGTPMPVDDVTQNAELTPMLAKDMVGWPNYEDYRSG